VHLDSDEAIAGATILSTLITGDTVDPVVDEERARLESQLADKR